MEGLGLDDRLRAAAFAYMDRMKARGRESLSYRDLEAFEFEGRRVPLIGQTGIRKVRGVEAALSIMTTFRARPQDHPYEDEVGDDWYGRYKWRGTDPGQSDNVALRRALELAKPLTWFVGVGPATYTAIYPVLGGQ